MMPTVFKGTVTDSPAVEHELKRLAEQWPLGAQIVHVTSGRTGFIRLDEPPNVPGVFHGRPTAWCLRRDGEAVSAIWDNEDAVPWRVWAPAAELRLTGWSR